ncbi:hypothetical protein Lepto7375DRAFT_1606 [Leptolyngbya sp. PCC 7375]|nr:hypothetical protein Lepto7375DRAFT_1606 [Leptolyngbya sp. PCC 7375]
MPQSYLVLNTLLVVTSLGVLSPQVVRAVMLSEKSVSLQSGYRLEGLPSSDLPLAEPKRITQVNPRQLEADRLLNEGIEQYKRGDWKASLITAQQALAIYQEISSREGKAKALFIIGALNRLLGNYPKALNYYAQSLVITREIGDRVYEASVLNGIGIVNQLLGNYSEALNYYTQSLIIKRELDDLVGESSTLNNIGSVNQLLGNYPEALNYYTQSLMITRELGDRTTEAAVLINTGSVNQLLGNYPEALNYYTQSLVITRELGDLATEAQALNNIGELNRLLGNYPEALNYYTQSLVITRELGDRRTEALTLNNIGELNRLLENYSEALNYYTQSLMTKRELRDRANEAITLANMGFSFKSQGKPVLAIVFFKQAINIYEDIRSNIQVLDRSSQESFKATIEDRYRTLADLLLQQNRVIEAQRVIDLLKVQELDDTLRGVRGTPSTSSGVPLLEEEKILLAESQRIFQQGIVISQELSALRQIPLAERTTANNERIFALENQQAEILTAFLTFVASPEVANLIANLSDIAKQGDLVTKLASDEFINLRNNLADIENAALIYPLILENRLELVLVTSSGPPTHYPITVDEDTLRDTVFEFQQTLRDKTSTPEPLAQKLYDWIIPADLETALTQQDIETILYAPDGILRYIPLAALHDGDQWLIERYQINHITAASLTDLNLEDDPEPLVLAGAFSEGNHPSPAGDLWGLPYAGLEVENLAKLLPTSPLLLNKEFSLAGTVPLMNDHTIVHFATHAAFMVESPLESFIMFGNGDRLTLQELKNWRGRFSNVDLMVLSACETGVGNVRDADGEEILGFGYLMQAAGASAAMASLWQVSDGGTQILMTEFYQALKNGMGKAEALQHAQRKLIDGKGVNLTDVERIIGQRPADAETIYSQLSHPYYWAPFILIGNGL